MRVRRGAALLSMAVALTAAAAACKAAPATDTVEVWYAGGYQPVGQVVAADGVAVAYMTEDRSLFLIGLDPATGKRLWKQEASPSFMLPGQAVLPAAVGRRIAYFRPVPTYPMYTTLVVADAHTGADVVVGESGFFASTPQLCGDDDVCVYRRFSNGSEVYHLHADVGGPSGAGSPPDTSSPPSRSRSIGPFGLIDLGVRDPEYMGEFREGTLRWQIPLQQAFPDGFSTDYGWDFHLYRDRGVYVGSLRSKPSVQGDQATYQADQETATAGVSEATGEVMWRERGTMAYCSLWLDVPVDPVYPDLEAFPVRCRATGRVMYHAGSDPIADRLTMAIEGFDPATGRTTWAVDLGALDVPNSPFSLNMPALAGPSQVALVGGNGALVVDLANGASRRPGAGEAFWCSTRQNFEYKEIFGVGDQATPNRLGGLVAKACAATRDATATLPSWIATRAAGTQLGEIVVMATANGFAGYRAG